jgi:hypothetical protein
MGIIIIIIALVAAASARPRPDTDGETRKLPGSGKPPRPAAQKISDALCSALRAPESMVTGWDPVVATTRVAYPAGSWPSGPRWSPADIAALPPEDADTFAVTSAEVGNLLQNSGFLKRCTETSSVYAASYVDRKGGKYRARWTYEGSVTGWDEAGVAAHIEPDIIETSSLRDARELAEMATHYFGHPPVEGAKFDRAIAFFDDPQSRRVSGWVLPGGGYQVLAIEQLETGGDGESSTHWADQGGLMTVAQVIQDSRP